MQDKLKLTVPWIKIYKINKIFPFKHIKIFELTL